MKTLFDLLYENQLVHWLAALAGIVSLVVVRVLHVKDFSWKVWVRGNLIGLIWSLFVLSLSVTLTALYTPEYTLIEAFFTGYCGAHVIFRLNKEPKTTVRPPDSFNDSQSN